MQQGSLHEDPIRETMVLQQTNAGRSVAKLRRKLLALFERKRGGKTGQVCRRQAFAGRECQQRQPALVAGLQAAHQFRLPALHGLQRIEIGRQEPSPLVGQNCQQISLDVGKLGQ